MTLLMPRSASLAVTPPLGVLHTSTLRAFCTSSTTGSARIVSEPRTRHDTAKLTTACIVQIQPAGATTPCRASVCINIRCTAQACTARQMPCPSAATNCVRAVQPSQWVGKKLWGKACWQEFCVAGAHQVAMHYGLGVKVLHTSGCILQQHDSPPHHGQTKQHSGK